MTPGGLFPTKRLKWMADIRPSGVDKHSVEGELGVRLCNYTDVYRNDRISDDMSFMAATASEEEVRRFSLLPGDVIITKDSETPDDIAVPAVVMEPLTNVVCAYHLTLLRPFPGTVGRFLFWCLKAAEVNSQMSLAAQGVTRFGITTGATGRVRIPCPDEAIQLAVADFLDRETGKIDALIAEAIGSGSRLDTTTGFIALLRERRAALISAAVTGRLDVRGAASRDLEVAA
jgi:type I restriction enzyme S subunit